MNRVAVHPRILEAKRRATTLNTRTLAIDALGKLIEDKTLQLSERAVDAYGKLTETYTNALGQRIVKGYAVVWGQRNWYGEIFIKGAFAQSIQQRGPGSGASLLIKFLNQHKQAEALALFSVLQEDEIGLYFETVPLDVVPWAETVLTQLTSGTLNNFSIGFDYDWDYVEWDDTLQAIIIKRATLLEISVVSISADFNTYAIRSIDDLNDVIDEIDEDIDNFINDILPRRYRLEARALFARQKTLINAELPPREGTHAQQRNQPSNERGQTESLTSYLIKNLTSL